MKIKKRFETVEDLCEFIKAEELSVLAGEPPVKKIIIELTEEGEYKVTLEK